MKADHPAPPSAVPPVTNSDPSFGMLCLSAFVSTLATGIAYVLLLAVSFWLVVFSSGNDVERTLSALALWLIALVVAASAGIYTLCIRHFSGWIANYRPGWPMSLLAAVIAAVVAIAASLVVAPLGIVLSWPAVAFFLRWRAQAEAAQANREEPLDTVEVSSDDESQITSSPSGG